MVLGIGSRTVPIWMCFSLFNFLSHFLFEGVGIHGQIKLWNEGLVGELHARSVYSGWHGMYDTRFFLENEEGSNIRNVTT